MRWVWMKDINVDVGDECRLYKRVREKNCKWRFINLNFCIKNNTRFLFISYENT